MAKRKPKTAESNEPSSEPTLPIDLPEIDIYDYDPNEPQYRLPPDVVIRASITPLAELVDWSATFLGLPELWKKHSGEGVKVAILDTGVDATHPDLQGKILAAKDFTGSPYGPDDRNSHGTWCAGAIAANADGNGIRGVAYKSKLIIAKVLGDQGSGSDTGILKGMQWCFAQGADIFSLSLGGGQMSDQLHNEFLRIAAAGKMIICAAGNDSGPINYPAAWADCTLSVGACDDKGRLTKFSSRGPTLGVVAPGQNMVSTIPGGKYGSMTGTSMATPVVAAVTALVLAKDRASGGTPTIGNIMQLREVYKKTAKSMPDGPYGIINPSPLLAQAQDPVTGGSYPAIPGFAAPLGFPPNSPNVLIYIRA